MTTLLQHEWLLFRVALQFLTRWPVASFERFDVAWLSESLRYFPLVGVFVALLQWLLWLGLVYVLPHPVALAFVMGFGLLLTGGFHEDGWADVCDGMGGASTRERVLTIMKDSRVGAFGAMGLVWVLLTKWTVLSYLNTASSLLLALVMAHALSRLAATALIVRLDHVGDAEHSKTKPLGNQMTPGHWLLSAAMTLGVVLMVVWLTLVFGRTGLVDLTGMGGGWLGSSWLICLILPLAAGLAALLCSHACGAYFRKRIGGYTGDCLGATQQISELVVYAVLLAVMSPARWS